MWPFCSFDSILWGLLPLLIGLLTGWWAWARSNSDAGLADSPSEPAEPHVAVPEPSAPAAAFEAPKADSAPSGLGLAGAGVAGAAVLTAIGIPAAVGDPDNLLQIKGVGPKLNALLTSLGITRFDQIAAWGTAEIDKVDDHLGSFKNRITRDSWVEQAGLLAKGMIAEFEAKFGKLDSENK